MDVSELTLRLLFLFLPGVLWALVSDTYTVHRDRPPFLFLVRSFIFGCITYLLYWIIIHAISFIPFSISFQNKNEILIKLYGYCPSMNFFNSLFDAKNPISIFEVSIASVLGIIIGVFYSWIINKKYHFRVIHKFDISRKFADLDVWGFIFNSDDLDSWVCVRDHNNDLVYHGWVNAFSEESKNAEILLRDVSVYKNSTADPLYQVGCMYISRLRENITIEFGNVAINDKVKWKENENEQRQTTNKDIGESNK